MEKGITGSSPEKRLSGLPFSSPELEEKKRTEEKDLHPLRSAFRLFLSCARLVPLQFDQDEFHGFPLQILGQVGYRGGPHCLPRLPPDPLGFSIGVGGYDG